MKFLQLGHSFSVWPAQLVSDPYAAWSFWDMAEKSSYVIPKSGPVWSCNTLLSYGKVFQNTFKTSPAGICTRSMTRALVKWAVALENKVRWLSAHENQVMKLGSDCEEKCLLSPFVWISVTSPFFYDSSVAIWNKCKHYRLLPTYSGKSNLVLVLVMRSGCCQYLL